MSVCDLPVISSVCSTVGEAAATVVMAPFQWLASAMGAAAGWLFEAVWQVMDTTTLVDVANPAYVGVYNIVFGIAIVLTLGLFLVQTIGAALRRDPGGLGRGVVGLGKAILGGFVALTLIAAALEITDLLSTGIVHATGQTMHSLGTRIAALATGIAALNIAAPGVGAILGIFLGSIAITAAAIVWFSLLIRKCLILLAAILAPIALAGSTWDPARTWLSRWASFLIALIISKLVLTITFLIAAAQAASPLDADLTTIGDLLSGIALMMIAAFAPYLTYKMINFIGIDMYHAMSTEQEAKQALNRPTPTTITLPPRTTTLTTTNTTGSSSGTGSSGSGGGGGNATTPATPAVTASTAGTPTGTGATSSAAGAGGTGGTAGAGAGTTGTTSGAAAGGAAAAAGPVGIAVIAAGALKKSADAGPALGSTLGQAADQTTTQATAHTSPPPSGVPAPSTPPGRTDNPNPTGTTPPSPVVSTQPTPAAGEAPDHTPAPATRPLPVPAAGRDGRDA